MLDHLYESNDTAITRDILYKLPKQTQKIAEMSKSILRERYDLDAMQMPNLAK